MFVPREKACVTSGGSGGIPVAKSLRLSVRQTFPLTREEERFRMAQPLATQTNVGASVLALGGMAPTFTGDNMGPSLTDFLRILEQVGEMGGWQDNQLIGIARCKMVGAAYCFAWQDAEVTQVKSFTEFKALAKKRFDTEPAHVKLEKFMGAKQNAGEDVWAFASRLRGLGNATLANYEGDNAAQKREIAKQILRDQLLTHFLNGLRDPVRRFTLSRDPENFEAAIEVAAKEEMHERTEGGCPTTVRRVDDSQEDDVRARLDRLERMLEASPSLRDRGVQRTPTRGQRRGPCYVCGEVGHFARQCRRRHNAQTTDSRVVDVRAVPERESPSTTVALESGN